MLFWEWAWAYTGNELLISQQYVIKKQTRMKLERNNISGELCHHSVCQSLSTI